jgi:hypothetical protein
MEKIKTTGTRAEVFHGKAKHTSGGLKKVNLVHNKHGRIVSKNASAAAKKNNNLVKAGYTTEKGKFGSVYVGGAGAKKTAKGKKSPTKAKKSPTKKKGTTKKDTFSFF